MKIVNMKPKKILSRYQKEFIRNNYLTMKDKEMSEILGLSVIFLLSYRLKINLSKNKKKCKILSMKNKFFNVDLKENWAI